jgi:hypothetical protein
MAATDNGGGNVTIASGLFWADGEILKFSGYTGAYTVYVHKGSAVITTKTFFNGSTQNVYEEQVSSTSLSAPGGQYILFNFDTTERLVTKLNAPALAALAAKADIAQAAEITPTLTAPHTAGSVTPTYHKDTINRVYLSGFVALAGSNTLLFTLPLGYRPATNKVFAIAVQTFVGGTPPNDSIAVRLQVGSNGEVRFDALTSVSSGTIISLDGVNFRAL